MTVKVAVAEWVPSVALTVYPPTVTAGTAKEQVNVPVADEVHGDGVVATVAPLNVIVIVALAVNPLPPTDTVVLTGPLDGVSVMLAARGIRWADGKVTVDDFETAPPEAPTKMADVTIRSPTAAINPAIGVGPGSPSQVRALVEYRIE